MPIVKFYVSKKDFFPNVAVAKKFIKLIQNEYKVSDEDIAKIMRCFRRLVKPCEREHFSVFNVLGNVLSGKVSGKHEIDVFFSMIGKTTGGQVYRKFQDKGLLNVKDMGIVLAHLIQENCQPENYMRVQRATFELLRCHEQCDPYQDKHIRQEYIKLAERGFNNLKANSKGGKKGTARRSEETAYKLKVLSLYHALIAEGRRPHETTNIIHQRTEISPKTIRKYTRPLKPARKKRPS